MASLSVLNFCLCALMQSPAQWLLNYLIAKTKKTLDFCPIALIIVNLKAIKCQLTT